MSDPEILAISGLQLSNNTFSASPPGSLARATNGVISQKGVFQPRNGQENASAMPAIDYLPFALTEFQGHMLTQYGLSKTNTSQGLGYDDAGTVTPYSGTYNPVGDDGSAEDYMRMKFTLASLFLHFACATGPKVLETYNGTPRKAGLPKITDLLASPQTPSGAGAVGFIPYDSSVGYAAALKRITSSGQVLIGPPSNQFVVTNRFQAVIGGLSRTGTTVTATFTPGADVFDILSTPFVAGESFTLSPGEADFAAGTYVLTGATDNAITYTNAGAATTSTVAQELKPASGGSIVSVPVVVLPADAVAGDIVQLFRSVATSASTINPLADMYLVAEYLLDAGDIAAGQIDILDQTPQSVLKDPLYTNPSDGDGQGAKGANFAPPIYLDAAVFGSTTFYLGTQGQPYLNLQMLGVGPADGIQDGDTFTVFDGVSTTVVLRFKDTPAAVTDVKIVSDGTPAYNIAWTTLFFLATFNRQLVDHGLAAFGGTSPNGAPGGIRLERADYVQTPFQVKVSRPATWTPALQSAVYTNGFLDARPNGLQWGKLGDPEAVPAANANTVGVPNYFGRRCFGLKNALIILKEGDGIWSLTGPPGSFNLKQISKANTIAPDCAGVFMDQVWAYTDQGILRISDSGGVTVMSGPIITALNELASALPSETYAWSFAVPYETERRIMFFVPFEEASVALGGAPLMKAWVFSAATGAWTGPLVFGGTPISGIVSSAKKLWLGLFDDVFSEAKLTSERKTGSYLDIADADWANALTTTAAPLVVELALAGDIRRGTGISQNVSGTVYRTKVVEVLGDDLYEVAETVPWQDGPCTIYDPYEVEVQFQPEGTPGARKSLTRLITLWRPRSFSNYFGVTTLETDQIQQELEIDTPSIGYGLGPYGQGSYGNPTPMVVDTNPISAKWVNAGQFFVGFKTDEVWCQLKLQGLGMRIEGASAPVGRSR